VAEIARQLPESDLITTDTRHLISVDESGAVVNAVLCAISGSAANPFHAPCPGQND